MKKIKLFVFIALLALCSSASAQFTNTTARNTKTSSQAGNGATAGYNLFFETGYTIGIGDYDFGRFEVVNIHGYQFNSHIFWGMGVGYKVFDDAYSIPLFTDFRVNFLNNKNTPYFEVKLGYSLGDVSGIMVAPTFGYRLGVGNSSALTFSVAYELQRGEVVSYYYYYDYYYSYYYSYYHDENLGGIAIKLGFEF